MTNEGRRLLLYTATGLRVSCRVMFEGSHEIMTTGIFKNITRRAMSRARVQTYANANTNTLTIKKISTFGPGKKAACTMRADTKYPHGSEIIEC